MNKELFECEFCGYEVDHLNKTERMIPNSISMKPEEINLCDLCYSCVPTGILTRNDQTTQVLCAIGNHIIRSIKT